MRLAEKGFDVVAAVEIWAQVQPLKRQAAERGVTMQVEKLDVTNEGDRRKALSWNIEIIVNNAGVGEGGATVDVPAANMRNQFEVNVFGPLLLTQGIAKQMIQRGEGRIVWVSSREGLNVDPFTGLYAASKHALEAIAESMGRRACRVQHRGRDRQPGTVLDRVQRPHVPDLVELAGRPSQRVFDYAGLAFPRSQFDPEPVYATLTAVAAGEVETFRNLEPKSMLEETKTLVEAPWSRKTTDGLGKRPDKLQASFDMEPETPAF